MQTFSNYLAVAAGGAFGAVARHLLNQLLAGWFAPFPFSTFLINVSGSLAIGFLLTIAAEKAVISEPLKLFLTVGFLGAYTTFSTFEMESLVLFREKNFLIAFLYIIFSVSLGLLAVLCGAWLAKKV